jgi:hypothetical protein
MSESSPKRSPAGAAAALPFRRIGVAGLGRMGSAFAGNGRPAASNR